MAIVIVGPPGSGKTSAAVALSKRLGWSFLDIDKVIEQAQGCTVQEIFQGLGEPYFRVKESETLRRLAEEKPVNAVVATGGGIMITPGNFELMCELGPVVCLVARVSTLVDRLGADQSRPLLAAKGVDAGETAPDLTARLTELLAARAHLYSLPELQVETDGLSPDEVASLIRERLQL
jgi:shikimate kinase